MYVGLSLVLCCISLVETVVGRCYDPSPAFSLPDYSRADKVLAGAFHAIDLSLKNVVAHEEYATSSFSVEVTSSKKTLFTSYHTAREVNETRPGAKEVNGDSVYRVASITKVFTTLGVLQQHTAGNLSLDDSIQKYIPELSPKDEEKQSGSIPWHSITLRSLASQLSGIPREFAQADLLNELPDPTIIGLPPLSKKELPPIKCDEYGNYWPCSRKDLLDIMKRKQPVFAPNQKSTYSNVAFELLGLAIEEVTGLSYDDYISQAILAPIGMNASFTKPSDTHGVLPKGPNFWDIDEGVQKPTGGLFASGNDMSLFLRYVLTHYNALTAGATNWLAPHSWSTGLHSFFGMPWEIYRTSSILSASKRPVTFVTKSGGLPGYITIIMIIPDYDIGLTILTAGPSTLLGELRDLITGPLVRALEEFTWQQMYAEYAGIYTSTNSTLNSSMNIIATPAAGLQIMRFISNSTDVLYGPLPAFGSPDAAAGRPWHAQLIPTLLFKDESKQAGDIYLALIVPERVEGEEARLWDEFCITDVDPAMYGGVALNEVVFWRGKGGRVEEVELPGFRVRMRREEPKGGDFVVQR